MYFMLHRKCVARFPKSSETHLTQSVKSASQTSAPDLTFKSAFISIGGK